MFTAKIITPTGDAIEREVERLSIPTTDGIRTLLGHHVETVIPLQAGEVVFITERDRETVKISDGIFQFSDNKARLLVNEIIESEAKEEN